MSVSALQHTKRCNTMSFTKHEKNNKKADVRPGNIKNIIERKT